MTKKHKQKKPVRCWILFMARFHKYDKFLFFCLVLFTFSDLISHLVHFLVWGFMSFCTFLYLWSCFNFTQFFKSIYLFQESFVWIFKKNLSLRNKYICIQPCPWMKMWMNESVSDGSSPLENNSDLWCKLCLTATPVSLCCDFYFYFHQRLKCCFCGFNTFKFF